MPLPLLRVRKRVLKGTDITFGKHIFGYFLATSKINGHWLYIALRYNLLYFHHFVNIYIFMGQVKTGLAAGLQL
jgi:hypothetical protein